jgi:lysozyme family protein
MSDDRVDQFIAATLAWEGGYVDHSADKGGPTNLGITQATLSKYLGRPASKADVRALSRETAVEIYRAGYFEAPRLSLLPEWAQAQSYDCTVLHGVSGGVKLVQRAAGAVVDGKLGPKTAAAVAGMGDRDFNLALLTARLEKFAGIVAADPTQMVFLLGWLRRAVAAYRQTLPA